MRSEQAASAAIPHAVGVGIEAARCYSLGARPTRIVPSKQGPCATPLRSVQPLSVSNATRTCAPIRHPETMTPSSRPPALVDPPRMSAMKECSPAWTS